jgi:hypothetical protein
VSGNRYALLIGVSEYDEEAPLPACSADALDVYDALVAGQFDSENVWLLCHGNDERISAQPRFEDILDRLDEIKDMSLDPDDTVLFYFTGHGVRADGDYLLPPASRRRKLDRTAYTVKEIVDDYLLESGSRQVILMLDACRNEMGSTEKGGSSPKRGIGKDTSAYLDELDTDRTGVAVLFSCLPEEKSFIIEHPEMGARSSFSKCLADAIRSPEAVTLKEVSDYLVQTVPRLNRDFNRRPQKPYLVPVPHELENIGLFGNPGVFPSEAVEIIHRIMELQDELGEGVVDEIMEFTDSAEWHLAGLHLYKRKKLKALTSIPPEVLTDSDINKFVALWKRANKAGPLAPSRMVQPRAEPTNSTAGG